MHSGTYDDSSSQQVESAKNTHSYLETPSLPNMEALPDRQNVGTEGKPLFQVEDGEHNITNISMNVSQMNITAESEDIQELDESETFRPNTQGSVGKSGAGEPNASQSTSNQIINLAERQDLSKHLQRMNSGRTRQNLASSSHNVLSSHNSSQY